MYIYTCVYAFIISYLQALDYICAVAPQITRYKCAKLLKV